jgi:hypothetical protein
VAAPIPPESQPQVVFEVPPVSPVVPAVVVAPAPTEVTPPPQVVPPPTPSPESPPVTAVPAAPDPDLDEDDVKEGAVAKGDVLTVPRKSFNGRMSRERRKGREAAEEKLLQPVLAAGFTSFADVLEHATKYKQQQAKAKEIPVTVPAVVPIPDPAAIAATTQPPGTPPPLIAPPPSGQPPGDGRTLSAEERKSQRMARQQAAQAEADRKAAVERSNAEVAAAKAETDRIKARTTIGYKLAAERPVDIEFALARYDTHVATLDDAGKAALATTDGWNKWMADFKKANPFLFASPAPTQVPATTGPVVIPPPAPGPAAVGAVAGDGAKIDARTMTPAAYAQLKQQRGLAAR